MNEAKVNILELLTSTVSTKAMSGQLGLLEQIDQNGVLGTQESNGNPFDLVFDDILNEEINSGVNNANMNTLLTSINTEQVDDQQLVNNLDMLSEINLNKDEKLLSRNVLTNNSLIEEQVEQFNQELRSLNQLSSSVNNNNVKELLQSQSLTLANGQYNVVSSHVADNQLHLELDNSDKTIKISLPVDTITADEIMNGKQSRVAVQTQSTQVQNNKEQEQLQSLLEKVNVKQIEITGVDKNSAVRDLQPVEVTIIAENQGTAVKLKSSLKKNQIKVNNDAAQSAAVAKSLNNKTGANLTQKAAVLDESGLWRDDPVLRTDRNNGVFDTIAAKVNLNQSNMNKPEQLFTNNKFNLNTLSNDQQNSFVQVNNPIGQTEILNSEESPRNIRMQLPENLKMMLRPNGQAVTIKINPENLGPAKLSLSFNNNKLKAKLTVTSLNAKHMLENSIERLVDQLQKLNINVEKIDITLAEDNKKQEQFNRQADWQRKMTFKKLTDEEFENSGIEQTVITPVRQNYEYVNTGSVNLLA